MEENPRHKTLNGLTGLRGVAAYSVLLGHGLSVVLSGTEVYEEGIRYAFQFAYFGMTVFFVLSGFVIAYNYQRRILANAGGVRDFSVHRFARLFPLYLVTILIALTYPNWLSGFQENPVVIPMYLTMTQDWFNRQDLYFAPAWSISAEVFFYVLFAIIVLLIGTRKSTRFTGVVSRASPGHTLLLGTGILLLFSFALYRLAAALRPWLDSITTDALAGQEPWYLWLAYYSPGTRFLEFALGWLAAMVYLRHKESGTPNPLIPEGLATASLVLLAAVFLWRANMESSEGYIGWLNQNFLYAPFIAVVLLALTNEKPRWASNRGLQRLLCSRGAIALGLISYSVYMLQHFIFNLMPTPIPEDALGVALVRSAWLLVFFVLVTLAAYGSYRCIELPGQAWVLRRFGRTRGVRP